MTPRNVAALLLAAALLAGGCRARRAPAPAVPARPLRVFTPPPPLVPALVLLEEPAVPETKDAVSVLPPPPSSFRGFPPPPPVRRRPAPPPAKPEAGEPAQPEPPAAPEIRLGEVLPADVARQLERQLAANTAAARGVLERIRGRRLTREQADLAARIRAFLQQAGQMRARDLAAAAELSRRAALLAQELERNLR
ncbi:MAG: hypothetical protein WHT08_10100 [Bryobacteraceae bacterium]